MNSVNRWVLVAVAAAGLAAAPARAAEVSPLLPAETDQVVFVNVRQILDSDLVKKFALAQIKQALEGNEAQKAIKELGLDPLKDIDTVSGGLWGDNPQNMKGLFVVSGKFDLEKLLAAAEKAAKKDADKVAVVSEGKVTLIKLTVKDRPDPVYLSGADKNTLVIGTDKDLVTTAMKASETKGKPALKKGLAELIGQMDTKSSLFICGVSNGKVGDIPQFPGIDDPAKLKKQLEKVDTTSMTLRVTGDVSLDITMGMKDKDAADDFGATLDGLLNQAKALLPLVAGQNQNLKPVVNDVTKSLKSKVEKNQIVITAKLTGDAIGKAVGTDD